MYSVVLMAALTTGGVAPDCHRCGGCCGCYGGGYGYGSGCWGCYGGCYGCFGGCGGCWGGWGGCYGCWGGYSSWGCMGCMGCMGCYGGGYGVGGYGVGGFGVGGGVYGTPSYPGMIGPGGTTTPMGEGLGNPTENKKDGKSGKNGTMLPNRAKLVVELPANAKLFIDDMPMKTTSTVRSFNTPSLELGQAYYYMVRVEAVRAGKPVSETRRVIIHAGETARADFKDLEVDTVRTAAK
jgi:uncharacterized protein (TIGR03000 family)